MRNPVHRPPPTKFAASPGQAKPALAASPHHAPPPTRFGPVSSPATTQAATAQTKPAQFGRNVGAIQRMVKSVPVLTQKYNDLVREWTLDFERQNAHISVWENYEFTERRLHESAYLSWVNARYWYRAMIESEFEYLVNHHEMSQDFFGGIATRANYCIQYMTNNSPNRYLVEFAPPATKCAEGYLYLVYAPLGLDPKGEGGGGTIGLGDAGTALGAKRSKEINAELEKLTDENNTVLKIFNNMLRSKIITFRLVRLHVPK